MIFSSDWIGKSVYITTGETDSEIAVKSVGRIHLFIFDGKRCAGILVKRPDVALMFRRKDLFAAFPAIEVMDGSFIISSDYDKLSNSYLRENNIHLASTVVWDGMDVYTESGERLGSIDTVAINSQTGYIDHIIVSFGATSNALLGKRKLDFDMLIGFGTGGGARLLTTDKHDTGECGCIIVKDSARNIQMEGGAAEKAAKASVKAQVVAKKTAKDISEKAKPAYEKAKDVAGKAAKEGASVAGKKYQETKDGILGFKDEFLKAMNENNESK